MREKAACTCSRGLNLWFFYGRLFLAYCVEYVEKSCVLT
jgi:hypothetical protein